MSGGRTAEDLPLPGGDFRLFVTRLGYQALMSLGLLDNPLTGSRRLDLANARMLIDDLEMLREKTVGNLDDDEAGHIDKLVGDLRHALHAVESQT